MQHDELGLWYISKAYTYFNEAQRYILSFRYPESVVCAYESIEFSLKAMCKLLDVEYNRKEHFLDAATLVKLAEKIGRELRPEMKDQLLTILPVILGYTKELRNICRYGIDRQGVPSVSPKNIFGKVHCERVLKDADWLCDMLHQVDMRRRWKGGKPVKFGVLNGYVENPEREIRCTKYIWTTSKADFWVNYFSNLKDVDGKRKYDVKEIKASEIDNSFAVILNPFGEAYPEYSADIKPIYNIIRDYIRNGGIFVNTAGFPFFYAWIVSVGVEKPISEEKLLLPMPADEMEGRTFLLQLIRFTGTLYYKDFGAITTCDTKAHKGTVRVKPFQTTVDKEKFGDLVKGIKEITEFRALKRGVPKCIPIVRALRDDFGEVYPISALKFGRGFLLVAAMGMTNDKECKLFAKAVDSFCNWISQIMQTPGLPMEP